MQKITKLVPIMSLYLRQHLRSEPETSIDQVHIPKVLKLNCVLKSTIDPSKDDDYKTSCGKFSS